MADFSDILKHAEKIQLLAEQILTIAKSDHQAQSPLEKAAEKAAKTGSIADLREYLRQRRKNQEKDNG